VKTRIGGPDLLPDAWGGTRT